jgi:hypothetical protein
MMSAFTVGPPTWDDMPLAEGYLKKIRGFARNRTRFFRLTDKFFTFYARDRGELISYVPRSEIQAITDIGSLRFEVTTSTVFGASGAKSMVLEAPDERIKYRWVSLLRAEREPEVRGALVARMHFLLIRSCLTHLVESLILSRWWG